MITLEYLDDERKKLWEKIVILEQEISKKTSDYEDEAKQASKKASEYRNRSEEAKKVIYQDLNEANAKVEELRTLHNTIQALNTQINEYHSIAKENSELIKSSYVDVESRKEVIQQHIKEIEDIFDKHDTFVDKIKKLDDIYVKSDDYSTKMDNLYKSSSVRKKEIDQLYYEIMGYTEKDENTGDETKVDGLKVELEKSYTGVKENLSVLNNDLSFLKTKTISDYDNFTLKKESDYSGVLTKWETDYSNISKKIGELLPKALTAGLSFAYSEKKNAEVIEYAKLSTTFNRAILGMILVSLIPFAISIISLFEGKTLEEALLRLPRLVLSIMPLYVPVLWVAHSANRKMNLSKRLSEEYTHKEVLSKTFEGLSKQIGDIDDKEISTDLRIKLLYNILEVSSENPGKLISDYNKSDHPLMDALDKSVKLANAVDKLSKIPGLSKLTNVLSKKTKAILKDEMEKANTGLDMLDDEKK